MSHKKILRRAELIEQADSQSREIRRLRLALREIKSSSYYCLQGIVLADSCKCYKCRARRALKGKP